MSLRNRIRRWWMGRDLRDYAALSVAAADNCEAEGRRLAENFLRTLEDAGECPGGDVYCSDFQPPADPLTRPGDSS